MCHSIASILKAGSGSTGAGAGGAVSCGRVRRGLSGQRPRGVEGGEQVGVREEFRQREQQMQRKRHKHENVQPHTVRRQCFSPC